MSLPSDPIILMSVVNTKLRDQYPSLDELCSSLGIDRDELCHRLADAGFEYIHSLNQFR